MDLKGGLTLDVFMYDDETTQLENMGLDIFVDEDTPTKKMTFYSIVSISPDLDYPKYSNVYANGTTFLIRATFTELKDAIENCV